MSLKHDLLSRGYFPDKVPPTFTTELFGDCIETTNSPLPDQFSIGKVRELEHYELGRAGQLRRRLSIPNPISYYRLACEMESAWTDIEQQLDRTSLSLSRPIAGSDDDRALVPLLDFGSLPENRPTKRDAGRVLLKTDIANFYPSIYTHCISWALHGQAFAKANRRNEGLLGNRIDKLVQDSQYGQTKGIPVGPDTSLVIAELLLAPVDEALMNDHPEVVGFRHMDDYEIACQSRPHAEKVLASLQTHASEYELQLNPFKTDIIDLPTPMMDEWTGTLSAFEFRDTAAEQKRDLLNYFDATFRLSRKFPDQAVTAFALRRLARQADLHLNNWAIQEALTIQAAVGEPGALAHALEVLLTNRDRGAELTGDLITKALTELVLEHAPLGHHSEVAWSIWAAMAMGYHLGTEATSAISKVDNSIVALLALDARNQNALNSSLDTSIWEAHMTADELHGPHWLLSYEGRVKSWLPSTGGGDHVGADSAFHFLRQNGVFFYDEVDPDEALEALQGFLRRRSGY